MAQPYYVGVIIPIVQMMKSNQLLAGIRIMISLAPKSVMGIKKSEKLHVVKET